MPSKIWNKFKDYPLYRQVWLGGIILTLAAISARWGWIGIIITAAIIILFCAIIEFVLYLDGEGEEW